MARGRMEKMDDLVLMRADGGEELTDLLERIAEEVAQETWVAMLHGLAKFEGRSTLRTWLFRILTNRAMTRGKNEQRTIPFSALSRADDDATVPVDRFLPPDHPAYAGHWAAPPQRWDDLPETRLLAKETQALVVEAINNLPASQRAVG
jgi:RNA polymerase sigma-70 factor (ECF subfamily)